MENENVKVLSNIQLPQEGVEIYGSADGLSLQNLFIATCKQGGNFPSCHMFTQEGRSANFFDIPALVDAINADVKEGENAQCVVYETENLDNSEVVGGYSFVFPERGLFFRLEKSISESYILFLNNKREELGHLLEIVRKYYASPEEEKGNVFKLAQDQSGFKLAKQPVKEVADFDINLQYNDDFPEIDEILRDFIEDKGRSGLVFLHGEKGTGKTTYIRHLINEYPEKKFVMISPSMVTYLGTPGFTEFMHNRLNNTVIILEDCEAAIGDRKTTGSNNSVSELLNISDGLMSDDLGIKFICTFNSEMSTIDEALTRKGRMAVDYEFKVLVAEKTKVLIPMVIKEKIDAYNESIANYNEEIEAINEDDEMGNDEKEKEIKRLKEKIARTEKKITKLNEVPEYTDRKGMSLADIYNIEDKDFIKKRKNVGFE